MITLVATALLGYEWYATLGWHPTLTELSARHSLAKAGVALFGLWVIHHALTAQREVWA